MPPVPRRRALAQLGIQVHTRLSILLPRCSDMEPLIHRWFRQCVAPAAAIRYRDTSGAAEAAVVERDGAAPALIGVLRHDPAEVVAWNRSWNLGPEGVGNFRHVVSVSVERNAGPLAAAVEEER